MACVTYRSSAGEVFDTHQCLRCGLTVSVRIPAGCLGHGNQIHPADRTLARSGRADLWMHRASPQRRSLGLTTTADRSLDPIIRCRRVTSPPYGPRQKGRPTQRSRRVLSHEQFLTMPFCETPPPISRRVPGELRCFAVHGIPFVTSPNGCSSRRRLSRL